MVGENSITVPEVSTDRLVSQYLRHEGSLEELGGLESGVCERLGALPPALLAGLRRSMTARGLDHDRRARMVFLIDQAAFEQEHGPVG